MRWCGFGGPVLRLGGCRPGPGGVGSCRPRGSFGDPRRRLMILRGIPLLRGMNVGDRVRCEGPRVRWPAVLLLLALRTRGREVPEEGGIRRPRGLGSGPWRSSPEDRRLPREGGAGVRAAAGSGRGMDPAGAYLCLEV